MKETNQPEVCKPKKHPGSGCYCLERCCLKAKPKKQVKQSKWDVPPKTFRGIPVSIPWESAAPFPPSPAAVCCPLSSVHPPPPHHFTFRLQPWRRSRSTSTRTTSPARWRRSSTPPARRSLKNLPLSWCVRLFFARVFWLVWSSCERFGCLVLVVVLFVFVICFVGFCLF